MQLTGGEALVAQLVREGVTDVFGVPGQQLDHALDALAKAANQIRYITCRHEQGASYMADGYARASGRVGVCSVVPGPGLLNAMAGLATAYACSSPVLAIVGQIPSPLIGRGIGVLHEIRGQSQLLDAVTKWHRLATSPAEIPGLVREAFVELREGRPQPVALEIPPDVLAATADVTLQDPVAATGSVHNAALIEQAVQLLAAAKRPLLYVGSGVIAADATAELQAVAEALGAPVIMTRSGRGALSDRHPLALSRLGGRKLLPEADVVLAVGTRFVRFNATPVQTAPGTKLIMIDADPASLGPPRDPDLAIQGDARTVLAQLQALLPRRPSDWGDAVARARAWMAEQLAPIEPQMAYLMALRAAMPDDAVLATDLTQVAYPARVGFPFYAPRSNLTSGYQGTLGFAFPTALGAKIACPGRAVVALTGDGGFGWALQELATARQYDIAVVTIVFNDNGYGNVRRIQEDDFAGRVIGTTLRNPDFVALARAYDITAVKVEGPAALGDAVKAAIAAREPTLIEVPIGDVPSPWHLLG